MNIHIIPGTECLPTVLAAVGDEAGKVFVLDMFNSTAPITVHLTAESTLDSPGTNIRTLLQVTRDHQGHILQV